GERGHSSRERRAKAKAVRPGSGVVGAGAGRAKAVNRNGKRLLVYVLDVAATLAQNQVVIDLARRQRKTTGEWGPLRPWYYAPRAAPGKSDPEARLILALLDEAQGSSPHAGYLPSASGGPSPSSGSTAGGAGVPLGAETSNGASPSARPAPAYG